MSHVGNTKRLRITQTSGVGGKAENICSVRVFRSQRTSAVPAPGSRSSIPILVRRWIFVMVAVLAVFAFAAEQQAGDLLQVLINA
jgi:hypothetical protein